jgi:transcription-repair coupling factor (superfamily II helicase)
MSLGGMRDMSIIATPPTDRRAIRTFVTKFDPNVVKEAIEREIGRGGQVYFLHNRVDSIDELKQFVQELCPKVRIGVGHGQMGDGELEEVMTKFVERQFDVLICTTIIESGLDIPTANTMLVNRADTFGLAQLYQIRGRVGRARERAYCYLFVPAERPVTKDAKKRLQVLQQFSELGAGFHIASHDMEIRGAGNLLGPDQSGSVAAVGFDLYSEMMEEAVRELRGEPPREDLDPDVTLSVPAYIPDDYVPEVPQRLLFYKRLAQAQTDDELFDVRGEMADRFGELPTEVDNLCQLMSLKAAMRKMRLRAMESGPGRLVVTLGLDAKIDPIRMAQLVARSKEGLKLTPDMKLVFPLEQKGKEPVDLLAAAHRMMRALTEIQQQA